VTTAKRAAALPSATNAGAIENRGAAVARGLGRAHPRDDGAGKGDLPWLKFARFGPLSTKNGSLRWNGNVTELSGVVGDYDGEKISIDEAVERLDKAGIRAVIYSSPTHMWDGHGPR
jgi:hypothetical protein